MDVKDPVSSETLLKCAAHSTNESSVTHEASVGESSTGDSTRCNSLKLGDRLIALSTLIDCSTYRMVALLAEFDRAQAWKPDHSKSCVSWLNAHCGLRPSAAHDRLRVAYALEQLPILTQLFRLGELSWSKVRALTRIATPENERELARDALDMTASAIQQRVRQYRDAATAEALRDEDAAAIALEARRSLTFRHDNLGMVQIRIALPPLAGAAFLKALSRAEDILFNEAHGPLSPDGVRPREKGREHEDAAQHLPRQLRADAVALMGETYLLSGNADIKAADRYQVMVHVDAATLCQTPDNPDPGNHSGCCNKPAGERKLSTNPATSFLQNHLKAFVEDGAAIAASTARRLTCDCSLTTLVMKNGEPLSIGRKTRIWTPPIRKAIVARDGHCQFPGCSASHHMQIHHIRHWADGGETSVENGVLLCGWHHRLVHEFGYTTERTADRRAGGSACGGPATDRATKAVTVEDQDGRRLTLTARLRRFQFRRRGGEIV